jgi:hypothetical protein
MRVIVDRLEGHSVGSFACDEPFRPPVVGLAVGVAIADRQLDVGGVKTTLTAPALSVLGPDKALDLHEIAEPMEAIGDSEQSVRARRSALPQVADQMRTMLELQSYAEASRAAAACS